MNANMIGLEKGSSDKVSELLNNLLADYQIYYQNLRGFHWNVKGKGFFTLHSLYERLYTEAADHVDEIAERILMLGNTPHHNFEDYTANSDLEAHNNVSDADSTINLVLADMQKLLVKIRNVFNEASEVNDEGTATFMSDLISYHEKNIWMVSAYLSK